MPPIRDHPDLIEYVDDADPVITVLVNPRLDEGFFVAYRDGELLSWGRMGVSTYPDDADTIHLNPADYQRLKTIQARFDKEAPDATDR
jgi:hypothetical protein